MEDFPCLFDRIFPESLRWLLATQQYCRSKWIMGHIAKKNRVNMELDADNILTGNTVDTVFYLLVFICIYLSVSLQDYGKTTRSMIIKLSEGCGMGSERNPFKLGVDLDQGVKSGSSEFKCSFIRDRWALLEVCNPNLDMIIVVIVSFIYHLLLLLCCLPSFFFWNGRCILVSPAVLSQRNQIDKVISVFCPVTIVTRRPRGSSGWWTLHCNTWECSLISL